jgi:hypothetical protein
MARMQRYFGDYSRPIKIHPSPESQATSRIGIAIQATEQTNRQHFNTKPK